MQGFLEISLSNPCQETPFLLICPNSTDIHQACMLMKPYSSNSKLSLSSPIPCLFWADDNSQPDHMTSPYGLAHSLMAFDLVQLPSEPSCDYACSRAKVVSRASAPIPSPWLGFYEFSLIKNTPSCSFRWEELLTVSLPNLHLISYQCVLPLGPFAFLEPIKTASPALFTWSEGTTDAVTLPPAFWTIYFPFSACCILLVFLRCSFP